MSLKAGDAVFTGDRRKHRLGPLLKSGGAGSVYPLVESPTQVAKIYHDGIDHAEHERKVAAMLYLSPNLPDLVEHGKRFAQIAWPQSLLRDAAGRFVGFLMPAIDVQATAELECVLQERQARAAGLPSGLGAKVTLAANLCAVIAELHRQGHHVVDLKPVNVRFYVQTLYMAIIDCDGFSIQGQGERFLAHQITPDYVAPEFQGQRMPEALEEQQDRFALAVVVFQLLNFGIHPFTGRPANERVPTDIPGRIAQRCYAYGSIPNPDIAPSPVSGHQAMPAELRALFDRAFEGTARPSAAEWSSALRVYAQRSNQKLVPCSRDRQHQHFAGMPCAACARTALIANTRRDVEAARSASIQAAMRAAKSAWTTGTVPRPHATPMQGANPQALRAWLATQPRPVGFTPSARVPIGSLPLPGPSYFSQKPRPFWSPFVSLGVVLVMFAVLASFTRAPTYAGRNEPPAQAVQVPENAAPADRQADGAATVGSPDSGIRQLLGATLATSPYAVAASLENLRRWSRQHPQERKDYAQQFERGVIALESGDRNNANDFFRQAIADDPDKAEAWYGLALASKEDPDATAALAMAELLREGALTGGSMDKVFASQMVMELRNDPAHLDRLKGAALAIVARLKQQGFSAGFGNLPRRPMPVR